MLQDMPFGRLENEFQNLEPEGKDWVVCVRDREILMGTTDGMLCFPTAAQVKAWEEKWQPWGEKSMQYAFSLHGKRYFLYMGQAGACPDEAFSYEFARSLRRLDEKEICYGAMTAWHLYNWYRTSRYCGNCGAPTVHDERERMVRCPACGNMIFPRINPAIITAVTDGDRILLTQYAGRNYVHYALVAGFTEIGETLEETVQREVMEEVGLRVRNIRYYKSQPWGVDGNVLMGFYCDLDGDDTIHLDEQELSMAQWHRRDAIPARDDGISLTREMIRVFEEGREPKSPACAIRKQ